MDAGRGADALDVSKGCESTHSRARRTPARTHGARGLSQVQAPRCVHRDVGRGLALVRGGRRYPGPPPRRRVSALLRGGVTVPALLTLSTVSARHARTERSKLEAVGW